jgi:RND family efflux transporter MFP subunit
MCPDMFQDTRIKYITMKIKIILIAGITLMLSSCGTKQDNTIREPVATNAELVSLTDEQIKISDIQTGKSQKRNMGKIIRANGTLDVPPQSLVTISAPMGGFVKLTEVLQGMKVHKGQVIAELEHQDYIQLQQDYLESKIQLEFTMLDYEREKELSKSNVSSIRNLQETTSRYKSLQNKVNALENKLYLIGINAKELKEGNIQRAIRVISPIDGFITKVNVNIGKYVSPNDVMFEIVDTKHLHAEITVFEKDALYLKQGQKIKFMLANESKERTASIFLVSHSISTERTISVHAHLDNIEPELMPGMFVTALIETEEAEVNSLPDGAFVKFGEKDYVFVENKKGKDSNEFIMTEIRKGVSQDGFSEFTFLDKPVSGKEFFVTKGSFDLLAKLKNNEEE